MQQTARKLRTHWMESCFLALDIPAAARETRDFAVHVAGLIRKRRSSKERHGEESDGEHGEDGRTSSRNEPGHRGRVG